MAEYIDKEKAIKLLTDSMDAYGTFSVERSIYMTAKQKIKNIPAVDVAPVVHANWIYLDECSNAGVYCSCCHKKVYRGDYANQKLKSKYCPNCGARMDGAK